MTSIKVDFSKKLGKIKPMHATNNGPVGDIGGIVQGWGKKSRSNIEAFRTAGIPYARTHDSSFYTRYGLEHTVDVAFIFPDFDADPYDPASYDFTCTDHYMDMIAASGTQVFYRLGHRIEHEIKKYGTLPPKDFHKWAVICEHIIRHMNEGWADGAHRGIEYWEIWNEPDLDPDDSNNKRNWGGTKAQFFDFFEIAAKHLKKCFPDLKIGGPAISGKIDWAEDFLCQMQKRSVTLDFFSWHCYAHNMERITDREKNMRALLNKYGYTKTESILNEWNYVLDWNGDKMIYSHLVHPQKKGAAFNLATMCVMQASSLDMLMYYDARPSTAWNGIFNFMQYGGKVTTTAYYAFLMFNELYKLGESVSAGAEGDIYTAAALDGGNGAIVIARFNNDDNTTGLPATIELCGFSGDSTEVEVYILNDELTKVESFIFEGERFVWKKDISNFDCYLLKLKKA